ncbi:MAG: hypothetical protein LBL31_03415 [Spirochaetaceae bacterium]|jgi:hypothetical protein|nr:hypothetical protein [Spirochaetaceae bacterium]
MGKMMVKGKAVHVLIVGGICCVGVFLFLGAKFLIDREPVARLARSGAVQVAAIKDNAGPVPVMQDAAAPVSAARNAAEQGDATQKAAKQDAVQGPVIEIREKMFIAQTNEIYLNADDYIGKKIRLEGLFKTEQTYGDGEPYCFVLRYGPGCCGYDGSAGFEVAWSPRAKAANDSSVTVLAPPYPGEDAWVEAVGTLNYYEEDNYPYLYLQLISLTVKEQRGAEFVVQ